MEEKLEKILSNKWANNENLARNVSSNQVRNCHNQEIPPLDFFELIAFNSKSIATLS